MRSRPWDLSETERQEVYRALRFRHFKWDTFTAGRLTLLPETLVIPESLHQEVVKTVETLHHGLLLFESTIRREPEALERLGITRVLHPLIVEEGEWALQCARYDIFYTEDGRLMVSEFNEDVPGGFNEAQALPDLLGDPGPGHRWEAGFRARFLEAFAPYRDVALLYATAFSEDLQHCLILEKWLAQAGHGTVLGSPAHLARGWRRPRVLGIGVDAAFRYYPGEWMPKLPNFKTWRRVNPELPMMNPLRHLVRQSKLVFALWREDTGLSKPEEELLTRHCPRTYLFDPAAIPRLREEREAWVLKRAFGRMGDSVIMGNLVTERAWLDALTEAARRAGEWCIQERFSVLPLAFVDGPLYPALGAYVVNGRFAGYYSRAAVQPFLTHEAFHVATVVQNP